MTPAGYVARLQPGLRLDEYREALARGIGHPGCHVHMAVHGDGARSFQEAVAALLQHTQEYPLGVQFQFRGEPIGRRSDLWPKPLKGMSAC